jgi:5-methylcytosine-specific restriction endonuclease McrA
MKRIKLSPDKYKKLIHQVIERDIFCQDCGRADNLDMPHHIVFRSHGGDDSMENLVLLCRVCHAKRHGIKLIEPRMGDER